MVQGVVTAAVCLLLLELASQGGASRPGQSMVELDLAEASRAAQLHFEAGDPACRRFGLFYRCPGDASIRVPTPGTFVPQDIPVPVVEGAPFLFKNYPHHRLDCGPLGRHKFRCGDPADPADPAMETTTTAPVEVALAFNDPTAEAIHPDQSDCGPLGKHKYRCVPPLH